MSLAERFLLTAWWQMVTAKNPDARANQVKPLIAVLKKEKKEKPTDLSKNMNFDGFGCSKNNSGVYT